VGRRGAADGRGPADVPADAVLPDAGAALLHAGGSADDGWTPRPRASGIRLRRHEALARRGAVDHGGRVGRVRWRVRQRGGECLCTRLGADPLAEDARLSRRPVCGEQRHFLGDRHPHSAVDPADPLCARQRHERRRSLHRRCPAGPDDGGRLRCHLLVDRKAPRLSGLGRTERPRRALEARFEIHPRSRPSGSDPGRPSASPRRRKWPCCPSSTLCCSAFCFTTT
jgi:hypothetical protein